MKIADPYRRDHISMYRIVRRFSIYNRVGVSLVCERVKRDFRSGNGLVTALKESQSQVIKIAIITHSATLGAISATLGAISVTSRLLL